jgi:hypothetical protein
MSSNRENPDSDYESTKSQGYTPTLTNSHSTRTDSDIRTPTSGFDPRYSLPSSEVPRSEREFECFFAFKPCEDKFDNDEVGRGRWCFHVVEHLEEDQRGSNIDSMNCCGRTLDSTWKGLFEHIVVHYSNRGRPLVNQEIIEYLSRKGIIPPDTMRLPPWLSRDQHLLTVHTAGLNRRREGSFYYIDSRSRLNRNGIAHTIPNEPHGARQDLIHFGSHAQSDFPGLRTPSQLDLSESDEGEEDAESTSRRRSMDR